MHGTPVDAPASRPRTPRRQLLAGAVGVAAGMTSLTLPAAAAAASQATPSLAGDDQLLLYLDAGLTSSYGGSGTIWTDLSGEDNHASLLGSPTFISDGTASHLRFDGDPNNGQHAALGPLGDLTAWTIEVWARLRDDHTARITALVTDMLGGASRINLCLGTVRHTVALPNFDLAAGFYTGSAWKYTAGVAGADLVDVWHHHVATYDGTTLRQYLDGIQTGSDVVASVASSSGGVGIRIARRWDNGSNLPNSNYANVDMGLVRINARALTGSEVAANHDATKGRYAG